MVEKGGGRAHLPLKAFEPATRCTRAVVASSRVSFTSTWQTNGHRGYSILSIADLASAVGVEIQESGDLEWKCRPGVRGWRFVWGGAGLIKAASARWRVARWWIERLLLHPQGDLTVGETGRESLGGGGGVKVG